tara:strand:- start:161 stop:1573 length:1413 start_codon:yes stop_codon:yes gene_type:complete
MAYLGSTPENQSFTSGTDYFNGNGISVAFTLSRPVASVNDIEVVISNVVQQPSTAYTVSGTTITFTSAPPAGTSNVYARYMSTATQTITPSPGTVGTSQISPSLTNVPFFGGSTIGAGNATGMKNRLINGGMVLDQRNAGASVTPTDGQYLVDRWVSTVSQASKLTAQQSSVAPTGFSASQLITSSSAYSIGSADIFAISQKIEGFNFVDMAWGTASAKTVTLSFKVRSSLTGTFGGSFTNAANNRAYPFLYSISTADTWTSISVTVPGDTTGTWIGATSGIAVRVWLGLGGGSTYSGAAAGWSTGPYFTATGATSVVGTSGATFYVTGVQLEEGNAATSFEFVDYGRQLQMCQRYYQNSFPAGTAPFSPASPTGSNVGLYTWKITMVSSGYGTYYTIPLVAPMRASPSIVGYNGGNNNNKVRQMPGAVDFTVTSVTAFSNTGFVLLFYGGAGDGTGNPVGWNWSASAEL